MVARASEPSGRAYIQCVCNACAGEHDTAIDNAGQASCFMEAQVSYKVV